MSESAEERIPLLAGDEFREIGIIGKHIYTMSHYSHEAMLLLDYDDVDRLMKIIISIFQSKMYQTQIVKMETKIHPRIE